MSKELQQTDKTTISRHAERGSYDRDTANAILDEGMVAHVGFDVGNGVTVIPMTYARMGDELVLHGAVASRWLSEFAEGRPVSVCVTLLDGLVLARSAFNSSMNYRSLMVFGKARLVSDEQEKIRGLYILVEHLAPGRPAELRSSTRKELNATTLLPLESVRTQAVAAFRPRRRMFSTSTAVANAMEK